MAKRKTKLFTMKVEPDTLNRWKQLAESFGVPLAELIRHRLEQTEPPKPSAVRRHRPPPKVDPGLIAEVAAIGNNLNQIARRVNHAAKAGRSVDVLEELAAIEEHLAAIVEAAKAGELSPC